MTCSQTHISHAPSVQRTTGSLRARSASPGRTVTRSAGSNSDGSSASIASTRQWRVPGVAALTKMRQPPSGRRTSAGRSRESQTKSARSSSACGVKCTPSSALAIITPYPRPSPTGRRSRYASHISPSGPRAALGLPAQWPGPPPGAAMATSAGARRARGRRTGARRWGWSWTIHRKSGPDREGHGPPVPSDPCRNGPPTAPRSAPQSPRSGPTRSSSGPRSTTARGSTWPGAGSTARPPCSTSSSGS